MKKRFLRVCRLGRIDYNEALTLQKQTEQAVIDGKAPDTLFLLEHPHTYTIGRRASQSGILATSEILEKIGAKVFETDRGGKITYHGIGQIVGYPVINLAKFKQDVHHYVRCLEEVLIKMLSEYRIEAYRIEGLTGVHTKDGKVAAIGVHIKRWVTTHGFALNVNTDLSYFNWIIACDGEPVTSMERILGREIDLFEVEDKIIKKFAEVFNYGEVFEVGKEN
ncbi:MAG: lipoyl(octanoyl) transferase LipB [Pyrinomonadaceae bacterium]|nr:lipoyl(octanoyl) transferase LipB [Pyrinomonadaceae bacterium]MCX7639464.1 lipoyl(octanoyl) transferase LipB [Pyrinomonadaceae bacterium]MDW8304485.1 lipoyl(octanoyl) transferase LipB [Acidobacteriota bacterium]